MSKEAEEEPVRLNRDRLDDNKLQLDHETYHDFDCRSCMDKTEIMRRQTTRKEIESKKEKNTCLVSVLRYQVRTHEYPFAHCCAKQKIRVRPTKILLVGDRGKFGRCKKDILRGSTHVF